MPKKPKWFNNPDRLPKPQGDTSANEGVDGKPPPTWDPGKTTRPEEAIDDQAEG